MIRNPAETARENLIRNGQDWWQQWVTASPDGAAAIEAQIAGILDPNVLLIDYDRNVTYNNSADALAHLRKLKDDAKSVFFYPNGVAQQTVVGLDHLEWKPTTRMAAHDCVDLFEVNTEGTLVTEIRICIVRT